jgi:hypothetical protein
MNFTRLFPIRCSRQLLIVSLILMAAFNASSVSAQQRILAPTLLVLYPAGATAGTEVPVEITSQQQLEGADRLVFSHPGITAKRVMRAADRFYPEERPVEHKFMVKVAADVPPGIYEVRAGGKYGLSNPRRFVVGKMEEVLEKEDNNTPDQAQIVAAPVVLNGLCEASQVDFFWIDVQAGKSLVIDGYYERLDARGDLALALFTEQGSLIARSLHTTGRDPAILFTPASTGLYLLRVYEVSYNNLPNAVPTPYRVEVSSRPWIELIDPPIAQRGQTSAFTLYGRNLGPGATKATLAGKELEKVTVNIAVPEQNAISPDLPFDPLVAGLDWYVYRHDVQGELSNPVRIALANLALTAEKEPNEDAAAQQVSLPCEILGRFNRPNDLDWYSFEAKEGDEVWIEIDAQRLEQPVDPLFVVQRVVERENEKPELQELTTQDDIPSPMPQMMQRMTSQDASWLLKVPQDGTYRVMVRDQFSAAGAGMPPCYRLRIGPPRPDFRLLAFPGLEDFSNGLQQQPGPRSCAIPSGGAEEILIIALRRDGFDGQIEIMPTEQPSGITAQAITIGPGENNGAFIVRAAPGTKLNNDSLKLEGHAKIGEALRAVPVFATEQIWNTDNQYGFPARLTERIALSIDEMLPAFGRIEPMEQKVWRMARGGKLEIPVKFSKVRDDFNGAIQMGAIDLPDNNRIRVPMINVAAGSTGKLELDIQPEATVGMFTLVARGEAEVDYRRNLELAEQADADKKRIDDLAKVIQETFQQSQRTRQESDQNLNTAQQKRNQGEQLRNQAQQRMDQATEADKQAKQRVTTAQEQVAAVEKRVTEVKALVAAAGDENAKKQAEEQLRQVTQQLEQAQTQLKQQQTQQEETAKQLVKMSEELTKAAAEFKASEEQLVIATETRTKSIAAEQAAQADVQLSQRMQQEIGNRLNQVNNVARQQKMRLSAHSDPIRVEIVPYPVKVKLNAMPVIVKAGEKFQLSPTLERDFGFDGEVTFQIQGVNGVRFEQDDRIKQGQVQATLPILTDRNSPVGEHELLFIIRMTFNGRGLEQREKIKVKIQPAPEEKK